jgi:hypothetical protein
MMTSFSARSQTLMMMPAPTMQLYVLSVFAGRDGFLLVAIFTLMSIALGSDWVGRARVLALLVADCHFLTNMQLPLSLPDSAPLQLPAAIQGK